MKLTQSDSLLPKLLNPDDRQRLLSFLDNRFGLAPKLFDDFWIIAFSRQSFLFRKQEKRFKWPSDHFIRAGLPFLRDVAGYLKPTTVFIQRFGKFACKNSIHLKKEEISNLCKQGEIILKEHIINDSNLSKGYIIIKIYDYPLGAALFLDNGRLLCRFPKAIKEAFKNL